MKSKLLQGAVCGILITWAFCFVFNPRPLFANNIDKNYQLLNGSQEQTVSDKALFSDLSPNEWLPELHPASNTLVLPFPIINPRAYLVADMDSGQVFAEKNSATKLPIASVTKLMTAVVATEHVDLKQKITIGKSMLDPYGSSKYVSQGDEISAAQLFYPMLVESSNDAAQAVSCFLGNKRTIALMNGKARSLSMFSTSFFDAHGLSPRDVSTARDLFYLARYIANNHPQILEITRGDGAHNICAMQYPGMKNKNLVYDFPNFIGGKTGYIPESNYNGLFLFNLPKNDGSVRRVAIIILGAKHLQVGNQNLRQNVALALGWLKNTQMTPTSFAVNP